MLHMTHLCTHILIIPLILAPLQRGQSIFCHSTCATCGKILVNELGMFEDRGIELAISCFSILGVGSVSPGPSILKSPLAGDVAAPAGHMILVHTRTPPRYSHPEEIFFFFK